MEMNIDDCIKMLIAKEKCMARETSGTDNDCNSHNCFDCPLCYEQGNMGEQKKALLFAVNTLRKYQMMQPYDETHLKENNMVDNVYKDTDSLRMKLKLNSEYGEMATSKNAVFKIEFNAEQIDGENVKVNYKSSIKCPRQFTSDMFCEFLKCLCDGNHSLTISVMDGIEKYLDSHK